LTFEQVPEPHSTGTGSKLRDYILGSQDGLVNVLGLVLGLATATRDVRIVLIGGLAAAFAESIAMAAVAYTSSKAVRDFYLSEVEREKKEMEEVPEVERDEIRDIYRKKGFNDEELDMIVNRITSNKEVWLDTMISLLPLAPFVFLDLGNAVFTSVLLSLITLFIIGSIKARLTVGNWIRSGIEMGIIGGVAALAGYVIGILLSTL
jgi:predicted membrane protein (TIGR00267 family)